MDQNIFYLDVQNIEEAKEIEMIVENKKENFEEFTNIYYHFKIKNILKKVFVKCRKLLNSEYRVEYYFYDHMYEEEKQRAIKDKEKILTLDELRML